MGVPPVYLSFLTERNGCGIPPRSRGRVKAGGCFAAGSSKHILLCLIVKILPETLTFYKAQPSKQAEPFLLTSQGQNTSRAHVCLGVGSVGVLGAPSSDQGEDSMGSWEKALAVGSQASAPPEQPDLRSREAQINVWGLWVALMGAVARCHPHSIQICLTLLHFSCFHMDPLSKLGGGKGGQVENVTSLVFILFL